MNPPEDAPDFVGIRRVSGIVKRGRKCHCGKIIPPGHWYSKDVCLADGVFQSVVGCGFPCPHEGEN